MGLHNGTNSCDTDELQRGAGMRGTGCYLKLMGKESVTEQMDLR